MDQKARYVAYYRLPAAGGRQDGATFSQQKQAVDAWLARREHDLVGEFTEVQPPAPDESLPHAFGLALDCCTTHSATLIAAIGNTDLVVRARDVGIMLELTETAETPDASVEGIPSDDDTPYLSLRAIPRPPIPVRDANTRRGPAGNRAKADRFARAILPIIDQIRATGATTLTDIADALNQRQIRTARGRRWYPTTVRNILNRFDRDMTD